MLWYDLAASRVDTTIRCITALNRSIICKYKGKGSSLDIAPLTILDSGALQPRKWQLTGIDYSTAAQASGSPYIAHANGLLGPQCAANRHTTPQSTTLGLHPVIHVPNYMDHYSFTDPWGMDGWVGHVGCRPPDVRRLNFMSLTPLLTGSDATFTGKREQFWPRNPFLSPPVTHMGTSGSWAHVWFMQDRRLTTEPKLVVTILTLTPCVSDHVKTHW